VIPVYRRNGDPHLLFTRRSDKLSTHRGEISFPGGGRAPEDKTLAETALRETHEELGIKPETVRLVGAFDAVLSIHGFCVTPYVGEIPSPPVPQVNFDEVAEVIEVNVMRLLNEKIHRVEPRMRLGQLVNIHYYEYDDHLIWGMTGRIVNDLLVWLTAQP
jgi:8-oxo-dGTP pyrophosphatase MutT (NUDIX family)